MMGQRKQSTIGIRFAEEPTKREMVFDHSVPEAAPDKELTRLRSLVLWPHLEKETEMLPAPFKAYRSEPGRAKAATGATHKTQPGGAKRPSRSLRELRGFQPTRLRFREVGTTELDDDWYELAMVSLFGRVYSFANRFFGDEALFPEGWETSPWLEPLPDEFVYYASRISASNPLVGGWDDLLCHPVRRTSLITGILALALEACVFSELLFGADKIQKDMLQSQDIATIAYDGYYRTALRAMTVRACLNGPDSQPRGFWPAVDQLAVQTTALILPLINIRGRNAERDGWPDLCIVHQEVHDIVTEAAFLSNTMRRSSSIFEFEFPWPGEMWNLEQSQVHRKLFEDSEEVAKTHDSLEASEGGYASREGKVHIVLWPAVRRFSPIGATPGIASEGQQISSIVKAHVVYYSGREGSEDDATLFAFIRANKSQRSRKLSMALLSIIWILLCLTLLLRAHHCDQLGGWLEQRHPIEATARRLISSTFTRKST